MVRALFPIAKRRCSPRPRQAAYPSGQVLGKGNNSDMQEQADATRREPRPFPAIDPEPDHRYSWRALLRAGTALAVACAVAAGIFFGVRVIRLPAAGNPAHGQAAATQLAPGQAAAKNPARGQAATAAAPFSDDDGMIVFEQQPSGLLGTASPDGSHPVLDAKLGGLQGYDIPVASPDGRYLVNAAAQLITLGARGPVSVTQLPALSDQASTTSGGLPEWMTPTFADGGRYLAITECDPAGPPTTALYTEWAGWLIPVGAPATSGKPARPQSFGLVTAAVGDPGSDALLAAAPADRAAASQQVTCDGPPQPDGGIDLLAPGKPPKEIITAAALRSAAGWQPSTPVQLGLVPSPDGSQFIATMTSDTAPPAGAGQGAGAGGGAPGAGAPGFGAATASFVVGQSGTILEALPASAGLGQLAWSPDGRQVATCAAAPRQASTVSVLTVRAAGTATAGTVAPLGVRTYPLPGRHDVHCDQLLWSPDGRQLAYSGTVTSQGLTQADDIQHGWTIIDLRTGTVHDVAAPGQPAAWLVVSKGAA
jgi:hypothetical protein